MFLYFNSYDELLWQKEVVGGREFGLFKRENLSPSLGFPYFMTTVSFFQLFLS